jgi:NitT/TauT family transport system ATP-binding protein
MKLLISDVRKSYGDKEVLKGINIEINAHEFVCILGHSGCGKSTLLNLTAGYIQPDSGSITVDGVPISRPSKDRGVVFQDHALFPWFSVIDNISFGPEVQGLPKQQAREVAREYLQLVGLEEYANHYPDSLSGGMKQRVGIARALAGKPEILLMDEPFGALDILTRDTMRNELLRIWLQLRPMVLFITHSISEAIHLADKIIVMKSGETAATFDVTMARPRRIQDEKFVQLLTDIEGILTNQEPAHV